MVNRRSFLLFTAFLSLASFEASAVDCTKEVMAQMSNHSAQSFLQKATEHRADLIRGYHLPADFTSGYYARRVEPYLSKPTYAEIMQPQKLYRGMYLTPDELENILKNGMDLKRVNWNSVGGGISFSSNLTEASTYIFQSADQRANGLGVVFEVKMSEAMKLADDPVLNSTRTIFKKQTDVTRDEIQNVYLWGEYGIESLDEIANKAESGKIKPHESWTGVFQQSFSR